MEHHASPLESKGGQPAICAGCPWLWRNKTCQFEAGTGRSIAPTYICANLNVAPLGSTAAFTAASSALSPMNSTTTPLKEPGDACLNALSSTCAVVDELGPPAATMLPGKTVAATTAST